MNRPLLRRLNQSDFERVLEVLTTRQHLHPHDPVAAALAQTVSDVGVCPNSVEQSLKWLGLNPSIAIGRMRRTEIMQLARTVHRFWRAAAAQDVSQSPAP